MNNRIKKNVAREYLLFVFCLGVGVICFISLYAFVLFNSRTLSELNKNIEKRENHATKTFGESWPKLKELTAKDSIYERWETKWKENGLRSDFKKLGFKNPEEIIDFVEANSTDNLEVKRNEVLGRLEALEHGDNILNITLSLTLALFILIFPIRYLYISIKHSFNILKD